MKLDKNGDSEGNFSVLALVPTSDTKVYKNYTCSHQMRPVGQFFQLDSAYPVSEFAVSVFRADFPAEITLTEFFNSPTKLRRKSSGPQVRSRKTNRAVASTTSCVRKMIRTLTAL